MSSQTAVVFISTSDAIEVKLTSIGVKGLTGYITKSDLYLYSFMVASEMVKAVVPTSKEDRVVLLEEDSDSVLMRCAITSGNGFKWGVTTSISSNAFMQIIALSSNMYQSSTPLKEFILKDSTRLIRGWLRLGKSDTLELLQFINGQQK